VNSARQEEGGPAQKLAWHQSATMMWHVLPKEANEPPNPSRRDAALPARAGALAAHVSASTMRIDCDDEGANVSINGVFKVE
jgi:hypothetical protein